MVVSFDFIGFRSGKQFLNASEAHEEIMSNEKKP